MLCHSCDRDRPFQKIKSKYLEDDKESFGHKKNFNFLKKRNLFYLILLWIFMLQKVFCDFQNMNSNSKCFILKFQSLYLEFFSSWNDFDLISIQNNNKNKTLWNGNVICPVKISQKISKWETIRLFIICISLNFEYDFKTKSKWKRVEIYFGN